MPFAAAGATVNNKSDPPPPPLLLLLHPLLIYSRPKGYEDPHQIRPENYDIDHIIEDHDQDLHGLFPLGVDVAQVMLQIVIGNG